MVQLSKTILFPDLTNTASLSPFFSLLKILVIDLRLNSTQEWGFMEFESKMAFFFFLMSYKNKVFDQNELLFMWA